MRLCSRCLAARDLNRVILPPVDDVLGAEAADCWRDFASASESEAKAIEQIENAVRERTATAPSLRVPPRDALSRRSASWSRWVSLGMLAHTFVAVARATSTDPSRAEPTDSARLTRSSNRSRHVFQATCGAIHRPAQRRPSPGSSSRPRACQPGAWSAHHND